MNGGDYGPLALPRLKHTQRSKKPDKVNIEAREANVVEDQRLNGVDREYLKIQSRLEIARVRAASQSNSPRGAIVQAPDDGIIPIVAPRREPPMFAKTLIAALVLAGTSLSFATNASAAPKRQPAPPVGDSYMQERHAPTDTNGY
jgi:hypothetical protein